MSSETKRKILQTLRLGGGLQNNKAKGENGAVNKIVHTSTSKAERLLKKFLETVWDFKEQYRGPLQSKK